MAKNTAETKPPVVFNKFRISRRGRKLQISDDPRTLLALPKDVAERTWAEILQKEENELICFEIREEILEEALRIGYEDYMERQNALFTAHCAAEAWLKLIDWNFYRHDPGEEPSARPLCFIPKRAESWAPDERPDPSPRDTWALQRLEVQEECPDLIEPMLRSPSSCSLEIPAMEEIPEQYWFPGKILLEQEPSDSGGRQRPVSGPYSTSGSSSHRLGTESEVLQKITDYDDEEAKQGSKQSTQKPPTPVDGSLQGAGDSAVVPERQQRRRHRTSKSGVWASRNHVGKSHGLLPPLMADSLSRVSIISDCRLRNLRLDTHFEITPEKVDSPQGEPAKRK